MKQPTEHIAPADVSAGARDSRSTPRSIRGDPDRSCIKCGADLSRRLHPAEVIPMDRKPPGQNDELPVPMDPEGRLSTQPWMKHTEVSGIAALIVWFGMPKRLRGAVLRGAWMATLVVAALVAVSFGIAGFVRLVDWALLHG
jgi:hypothetical protein